MAAHAPPKPGTPASMGAGDIICPDPSAHDTHGKQLQEQASTAALYATNPNPPRPSQDAESNTRLSSASAAASLKHAKAQDLPSFPVVGTDTQSSAGTAAHLANASHQPFEHWKPDHSDSAGQAAMLAKDYKSAPTWHPGTSAAGPRAALLAHQDSGRRDIRPVDHSGDGNPAAGSRAALLAHHDVGRREPSIPKPSGDGNRAAGAAMRTTSRSPPTAVEARADSQRRALLAATGAFAGRKRSESTPVPAPSYPDRANSAHNALNAATIAHRPAATAARTPARAPPSETVSPSALNAARIQNIGANVPREMWTGTPPVALEVEEKRHQAALRGASISMAKNLYDAQAKRTDEAAGHARSRSMGQAAASSVREKPPSTPEQDLKDQALQYIHIQDAARKLAAERLSKIMPDADVAYRHYYGYDAPHRRSRLSIRGWNHRRASSEGSLGDSDDEERSRRIRSQMTRFTEQVEQVDESKRQRDRQSLMAAAERLVHARMHDMDEKVLLETGKVPPAIMEEWEAKARERAKVESEARPATHGKVHIGGGKYLDQSEIDAVAAARIQPTLDDINDQAEKQRARDEEIRLDQEETKRQAAIDKERDADLKATQKKMRGEEKDEQRHKKEEEKQAQRLEKDAEKARKSEERRVQKEDRRKSKDGRKSYVDDDPAESAPSAHDVLGGGLPQTAYTVGVTAERADDASPTSPSRFKSLMGKLTRRSKASSSDTPATDAPRPSASVSSLSSSDAEPARGRPKSRASAASNDAEERRDTVDDARMPSPAFGKSETTDESPARAPKFHENL